MKEKKTLSATPDQVAQALAGVEEVTLDEEFERKRQGRTQEPEAKIIERKPPLEVEGEEGTRKEERIKREINREVAQIKAGRSGHEAESSGEESLGDEVSDWVEKHKDYEFKNFDTGETAVEYKAGAPRLPLEFTDFLIGRARKTDRFPEKIERVRVHKFRGERAISFSVDFLSGESITLYFHPYTPFQLQLFSKHG